MEHSGRREFLKTTTMALGIALSGTSFDFIKYEPLLSFSTLGCPDWPFPKIIKFAAENDYSGIEIRGILRQLDLTKCPEFSTPQNIAATRKLIEEKKLRVVDLGSSCELHHADPAERKKFLDEARRFIDLAQALNCPYIRVFPNDLPKEQDRNATIDLIIKGLLELGDYANNTGVSVLLESHGEVVHTEDLKKIMQAARHPHVGLVWDVANMWTVTKEPPAQVYEQLKSYIRHTHIKDAKLINGNPQYILLGKGEVPIFEAIDVLAKANYKGYYSFEWEKLWHPDILEPEVALADYPKAMRQHFKS
jgi:sugar phosphate isomerase/epimerase